MHSLGRIRCLLVVFRPASISVIETRFTGAEWTVRAVENDNDVRSVIERFTDSHNGLRYQPNAHITPEAFLGGSVLLSPS